MAIALVVAMFRGSAEAVTTGAVESASTAVQIAIGLVGHHDAVARDDARRRGRRNRHDCRARPAAASALDVPRRPARTPGGGRPRRRAGLQHARAQQRRDPARHQGDGGTSGAQSRQGHGQQFDGHLHGRDNVRRPADSGDDDRCARRRRISNPTAIIGTSLVATFVGTLAAVLAARMLQRLYPQAPATARGRA